MFSLLLSPFFGFVEYLYWCRISSFLVVSFAHLHLYTYDKRMKLPYQFYPLWGTIFEFSSSVVTPQPYTGSLMWVKVHYTFLRTGHIFFSSLLMICRHFNINLDRRQFIISLHMPSSIAGWAKAVTRGVL